MQEPIVTGRFTAEGTIFEIDSEHYTVYARVAEWDRDKIKLFKGAGAKSIAPTNPIFKIKEQVRFDWLYETDMRICREPTLVYDSKWVGKEVGWAPNTKELRAIIELLKKETGWYMPDSWEPIMDSESKMVASYLKGADKSRVIMDRLRLEPGYVREGDLEPGHFFWSASVDSRGNAFGMMNFFLDDVRQEGHCAASIRCVTNS